MIVSLTCCLTMNSNSRITPANVIGKLLESKVLTQETLAALQARHDPYHDSEIHFCGMPTQDAQNVFCWNDVGSVDISLQTSPATLNPALPYNICVMTYPIGEVATVTPGQCFGSVVGINDPPGTSGCIMAPIAITYSQGAAAFPQLPIFPTVSTAVQTLAPDPSLMNEKTACCGWGIEIVNSTPLLDIGGMLTTAVVPQNDMTDAFSVRMIEATGADPGADIGYFQTKLIKGAPLDQQTLLKYQGSMQWNAKEGIYAVVPINFQGEIESPFPCGPMVITDSFPTNGSLINQPCWVPTRQNVTIGGSTVAVQPYATNFLNTDSVCIMLTGLNPLSTFTVRFKMFCMTVPFSNKVQIRAAKPPIPWDPLFYELDTKMRQAVPFATFVKNNPGGEWWKTILGTVADVAPSILAMIPHPAAKAAGIALTAAAPILKSAASNSKQKRKNNNASQKYGAGMKKNKQGKVVQRKKPSKHPANGRLIGSLGNVNPGGWES